MSKIKHTAITRVIAFAIMTAILFSALTIFTTLAVSASSYLIPDGVYVIKLKNTDVCAKVKNAGDFDGNPVILSSYDGTNSCHWRVENLGNNKIRLYSMASSNGKGRVMDMNMSTGLIDLYGIYNYVNDNTFFLKLEFDGFISIRRAADTTKVVEAVSTAQGTQLSILSDKSWATQRWSFKAVGTQPPPLTLNQTKVVAEAMKWIGSNKLPGGTEGYLKCQAWVYQVVYRALGINAVDISRATAKEAYNSWCISSNKTNIPVGATVYFQITPSYHVGIYVGDGMVVHMWSEKGKGIVMMQTLDSIGNYLGWGWQAGHKLN